MQSSADIVIIGAGVMGLSVAHYLGVERGASVLVLEKRHIGAGASGLSGAIIRQHYSSTLLVQMAKMGLEAFSDFEAQTGTDCRFQKTGCLIVGGRGARTPLEANVGVMQTAGVNAEILQGEALNAAAPAATFGEDDVGAWEESAGWVDPVAVLSGYAASVRRGALALHEGIEVQEIETDRGRVVGVNTSRGRVATRAVALCAGAWAGRLAARAGTILPLRVIGPQVATFRLAAEQPACELPVLGDLEHGYYLRPDGYRRVLVGALDSASDPGITDLERGDTPANSQFLGWARERVALRIPSFQKAYLRGGYQGTYTLTPDSHPILGEDPGVRGLYLAVGFSGHGFKLAPAVGRGMAELIVDGTYTSLDLGPLSPLRFIDGAVMLSQHNLGLLS